MLSNIDCYGAAGLQASSGEHVKALVGRTTDGLSKAMAAFDTSLARIKSGGFTPWTAQPGEMTLLHAQWVASLTWEWATVLTDAAVLGSQGNDIDNAVYSYVLKYCADAADQSIKAIQMANALLQDGKRPGNTAVLAPKVYVNPSLLEPMWALVESTVARVSADLALIRQLRVSDRFAAAFKELAEDLQQQAEVFAYHQDQWRMSVDIASRRQILQDAMKLVPEVFKIGQQIWAPYLLGRMFVDALRSAAVFEKYHLGIDPWVITAPEQVAKYSNDQAACAKLAEFWGTVADRKAVVALQDLINEAIAFGKVERIPTRAYQIVPWHDMYRALEPLTLGDFQCDTNATFAINIRGPVGQRTADIRVIG